MTDLFMRAGATFSDCGLYRYTLTRRWNNDLPSVVFCMLNPSTADHETNDPTITRCIGFSQRWGYGGLVVVNLFAFRSTDPNGLWRVVDPIGPDNDRHILEQAMRSDERVVVAAWGSQPRALGRGANVMAMLRQNGITVKALKLNTGGQPSHPLYIKSDLKPVVI